MTTLMSPSERRTAAYAGRAAAWLALRRFSLILISVYLLGAFVAMDFDLTAWESELRAVLAALCAFVSWLTVGVTLGWLK